MNINTYLIVITKKWGRNYTGATLATQYFINQWVKSFARIIVYTQEIGQYTELENVVVNKFESKTELIQLLKAKKEKSGTKIIGYSDDHLGYLFYKADIPYVHTYHGNWPDAKYVSLSFFLKSFYFIPLYRVTLKHAQKIVNVSEYMKKFTDKSNKNSVVINNGMDFKPVEISKIYSNTYLMVGNIDKRKYHKVIAVINNVFQQTSEVNFHIYGKIIDDVIAKKLKRIPSVKLMGQCDNIPYSAYCGLINLSTIENLSISVCEAIKAGIPVFCLKVGGLPEVVIGEKTGFVFEKYDISTISSTLISYAKQKKRMCVQSKIVNQFDWAIAAEKYIALFTQIAKDEYK